MEITKNPLKFLRYFFPILFFIPTYFFYNTLSHGIQWCFFRYQESVLSVTISPLATDLNYVLSGIITGKSSIATIFSIISTITLLIAYYLCIENKTNQSGLLTIFSGLLSIGSCVILYGFLFFTPYGFCIPLGSVFFIIYGIFLYHIPKDSTAENLIQKYDWVFLLFGIFLVYSSFAVPTFPNDTVATQLMPYYIVADHTVFLDKSSEFTDDDFYASSFLRTDDGHYVSLRPAVTPFLIVPIYIIPVFLKIPMNDLLMLVMAHISSALISSLACLFIFLTCKRLTTQNIALLTTILFAFATSTWSISSQTLYDHGTVELLLAIMFYVVMRNEEWQSDYYIVVLGFCTGLFIFNRPSDSFLIIPISMYIIYYYRNRIAIYIGSATLAALPFVIYNLAFFHTPLGGYMTFSSRLLLGIPTILNYTGLIIAPNKGLLVFSPILILAIPGYYLMKNRDSPFYTLMRWSIPAIALTILVYASFDDWMGGNLFGPRYLTCLLPYLAISVCIFLDKIANRPCNTLITSTIAVLIILSVVIQFTGIFYYKNGGAPTSEWKSKWSYYDPWDFRNLVIINSIFHKDKESFSREITSGNQSMNSI